MKRGVVVEGRLFGKGLNGNSLLSVQVNGIETGKWDGSCNMVQDDVQWGDIRGKRG